MFLCTKFNLETSKHQHEGLEGSQRKIIPPYLAKNRLLESNRLQDGRFKYDLEHCAKEVSLRELNL
jgi:hypothetical protein